MQLSIANWSFIDVIEEIFNQVLGPIEGGNYKYAFWSIQPIQFHRDFFYVMALYRDYLKLWKLKSLHSHT